MNQVKESKNECDGATSENPEIGSANVEAPCKRSSIRKAMEQSLNSLSEDIHRRIKSEEINIPKRSGPTMASQISGEGLGIGRNIDESRFQVKPKTTKSNV